MCFVLLNTIQGVCTCILSIVFVLEIISIFIFILKNAMMLKYLHNYEVMCYPSPPSTTKVPNANSLDQDETPRNSAYRLDPSCLTLRQQFHQL